MHVLPGLDVQGIWIIEDHSNEICKRFGASYRSPLYFLYGPEGKNIASAAVNLESAVNVGISIRKAQGVRTPPHMSLFPEGQNIINVDWLTTIISDVDADEFPGSIIIE